MAVSAVDVVAEVGLLAALVAAGIAVSVDIVAAQTPDDVSVAYYRSVHMDETMVGLWVHHLCCCRVCRISCACSSLC